MTTRTPWVGSVPSERIPPKPTPQQRQNRNEGKKKTTNSPEVQKLEDILNGLRREKDTKDPTGGCFCQASLLTPSSRDTLINQIEEEITQVIKKEEEERTREQQEREKAAGAFPTLAAATGTPDHRTTPQSRSVLSIDSKTRKVMVSSYVTPPPQSSPSQKIEVRESRPPGDIDYIKGKNFDPTSWKNLRDSSCIYVPLPPSPKKKAETTRTPKPKKHKKANVDDPTIGSTSRL